MTISKKDKQTTQTDNSQSSPKMLLQTIGANHLQKKYGQLTDYKSGRYNFWKMGDQVLKYYVHTDVRSKSFITALSKPTVLSSQKENATFIFIKYYGGLGNVFTVYFFQPEIIMKYYINANIKLKKGSKEWNITVCDDDEHMIFIRKEADSIVIPTDSDNYFIRFTMEDEEYEQLLNLLPEASRNKAQVKTTLKVAVQGNKGHEEFSITSAMVIALLSVLAKSNKPLTIDVILENMLSYGVLTRATEGKISIKNLTDKIVKIGGIISIKVKNKPKSYTLDDDIKVNVVI